MKTEDQINEENKKDLSKQQQEKTDSSVHHGSSSKSNWIIGIAAIILVLIIIIFLSYRHNYNTQIKELQSDRSELNSTLMTKDSIINNYMGDMNEIESTMDSIKNKENIISAISNGSNEQSISGDKKKQIIEDIKFMNSLLEKDKMQILKLRRELSHSGMKLIQFERRLKILENMVTERDSGIAYLKRQLVNKDFKISQLNQKLDTMNNIMNLQSSMINFSQLELNRVYYITGSFDELKKEGVIIRIGGFLGFGGTIAINSNSSDSVYKTIDMRQAMTIKIGSKSAKFISNHPKDSYMWVKIGDKISKLQIIDPGNFWKYTHYAVIETN
jgi:uncharacterized coiled-coil protein SlyX